MLNMNEWKYEFHLSETYFVLFYILRSETAFILFFQFNFAALLINFNLAEQFWNQHQMALIS